ncbi:DUF6059 family protein [Streptomyces sp. NPDC101132]|uniref:DUF6059 family protein n=1 Tax=Streptomyces sp. NPDC101132 TaxID=3366110 RepID=UPI0038297CBE
MNPFGIVRALWDGFVVLGLLHAVGERGPEGCLDRDPVYDAPPPGHPERLCPDVPLSGLELRLLRQLRHAPGAG